MSDVVIKIRENGPILISGPVTLTDHMGNKYDTSAKPNIALCRCGHSQQKPFCDGSHKGIGFIATGSVPAALPGSTSVDGNSPKA